MKLALLSTNADLGGAAIVTRRLCDALRRLGHDARMIVARGPEKGDTDAVEVVPRWDWVPEFLAERAQLWLAGVERKSIFKVSTGLFGVHLEDIPFVREADAILVNWASQGFLSLSTLEKLLDFGKPIIYTMHDLWPATAICHLPGECRRFICDKNCTRCPYLSTKRGERLIAKVAERKKEILAHPNLQLVAVSRWQRSLAMDSFILNAGPQPPDIAVIPHPFPIESYQPSEKITDGKRLIVMAAARLDDPVKDLPAAVETLNIFARDYPRLAADVEVAFVGELRNQQPLKLMELPYKLYGRITPEELRHLYARASVVLSSSKYETMGATLMEGMACGAIPVTFGDAGQTDIVDDLTNGFVAPIHTPASLAFALSTAFEVINDLASRTTKAPHSPEEKNNEDDELIPFTPEFLHAEVARRFSPAEIADRYIRLIEEGRAERGE